MYYIHAFECTKGSITLTLRKKTILITIITLIGLITLLYFTTGNILVRMFMTWENRDLHQHLKQIASKIDNDRDQLQTQTMDYSIWDDMYKFVQDKNTDFVSSNFVTDTFAINRFNIFIIINTKGSIVYYKAVNLLTKKEVPISKNLLKVIRPGSEFLKFQNLKQTKSGLIALPEGIILISAAQILHSNSKGPAKGVCITGRYLTNSQLQYITSEKANHLKLEQLQEEAHSNLFNIIKIDGNTIKGESIIKDINGKGIIRLSYTDKREINKYGNASLKYLFISLAIAGTLFWLVIEILLDVSVIRRVTKLASDVKKLRHPRASKDVIMVNGNDEISELGQAFNITLETLRNAQTELEIAHDELEIRVKERTAELADANDSLRKEIIERQKIESFLRIQTSAINAASDKIIITSITGEIEFVNPAFEIKTGYKLEEITGRKMNVLSSGKHIPDFYKYLWNTISSGNTWHGEITNRSKNGTPIFDDVTITPLLADSGTIEHFVAIQRDMSEKKAYEESLNTLAHQDVLTGLPNRLQFNKQLSKKLETSVITRCNVVIMFLDIDRFKIINDTFGHNIGDMLLKEVAKRLKGTLRDNDIIARMGGDEFTIIMGDNSNREKAESVANRIHSSLSTPIDVQGKELFVSASIGISVYPDDAQDLECLVKNADAAMYHAKENGRNNHQFYNHSMNILTKERITIENNLRKALERDEFLLYYQPQIELSTGRLKGFESLIRWQSKEEGMIEPSKFIPLAEETGLIVPIGEWVLQKACMQNKIWQDMGLDPVTVAVNFSGRQFKEKDKLLNLIKKTLDYTKLSPKYLDVEITESILMDNPDDTAEVLNELRKMGIKVSIDDFGTGYSSLNYLKRFAVNAVKIDRSFISEITTCKDDAVIAKAVIAMAHSLGLEVIAEGVETPEQLRFLKDLKCDDVQGYFMYRPLPESEMEELLKQLQQSKSDYDIAA